MTDNVLTTDDLALITEPHLGFVATVMADGSPQVTPVWVDTDGGTSVSTPPADG